MDNCTFCNLAKDNLGYTIYEDKIIKAFLDLSPISKGHILIIPKTHYEDVFSVPEEELKEIIIITQKLANLCKERLGATGVNILNASGSDAQQSIPHFHFHLVPRYPDDGLNLWFQGEKENPKILKDIKKLLE